MPLACPWARKACPQKCPWRAPGHEKRAPRYESRGVPLISLGVPLHALLYIIDGVPDPLDTDA